MLVVTDDAGVLRASSPRWAARRSPTAPATPQRALRQAAAEAHAALAGAGRSRCCADLPALRADDLDAAWRAGAGDAAFVADADGTGTTLYTAAYDDFEPRFGVGSALRTRRRRAPVAGALPALRRDVDDLDGPRQRSRSGVGTPDAPTGRLPGGRRPASGVG